MQLLNKLLLVRKGSLMDNTLDKSREAIEREAIDEYFECTSFCSIDESLSDCQTICMERFLQGNYF